MSFISNLTAQLPFIKKATKPEYFFALNIGLENIKASIWTIENDNLQVVNPLSAKYSSTDEILDVADKLLDGVLGNSTTEPEKILFGVPDTYLLDEELKEPYLKLIRDIVKSLEIQPMAYVATSHAVVHLLDKTEGGPTTAILVDIEKEHLSVSVARAGKIDGTKVLTRGDNLAGDVEKGLLSFTDIEVLPSRILILGYSTESLEKQKDTLLSFPWMDKLPFLHFPKIEIIDSNTDIMAVALAGAVEINPDVKISSEKETVNKFVKDIPMGRESEKVGVAVGGAATGFITGDITEKTQNSNLKSQSLEEATEPVETDDEDVGIAEETGVETEKPVLEAEEEPERHVQKSSQETSKLTVFGAVSNKLSRGKGKFSILVLVLVLLLAAILLLPQAQVTIFVEPKVVEKDTQVIADPSVKVVDEENKKIPGQVVETSVSGSEKLAATGKKQVGDPARGKVIIYNGTDSSKIFSAGTAMTTGGVKFTLTSSVTVASRSASQSDPLSTVSGKSDPVDVTAGAIGADGNIPSGTSLTVGSFPQSQVVAKSEGNFSGGTSKDVTVVTDADQKKLLAELASTLRKKAQEEIQGKLADSPGEAGKKILEEALTEEITKKTYSKGVNDQANEFNLNLTIKFSGIAYADSDLKMIVAKLVDTNIPEGYQLDLSETETQADVSKMEKNQLIFLARFKAKLTPRLDLLKIKNDLKGQSPKKAGEILRSYENVLESEVRMMPSLPAPLARLPLLPQRIKLEVKLK